MDRVVELFICASLIQCIFFSALYWQVYFAKREILLKMEGTHAEREELERSAVGR